MNARPLSSDVFETALGWVAITTSEHGIVKTTLPEPRYEDLREAICRAVRTPLLATDAILETARSRLTRYCDGEEVGFDDLPIDSDGWPAYSERARLACRSIPRGETRTYAWLAEKASGSRKTARAAARAMATNPLPLIIPCHRVIGSDGNLRGFGGSIGIPLKAKLLDMERGKREVSLL
jgi:methylated-DNA-[protein]-cysteine S-methyltransferase